MSMHPLEQSFLLVSTMTKKHPDLSFSNDRKVYQMRDREKGRALSEEREKAKDRNIHWNVNAETKKQKSLELEQTPKDLGMDF